MTGVFRRIACLLSILVFCASFTGTARCAPVKVIVSFYDKGDMSLLSSPSKADRLRAIKANAELSRRGFLREFADSVSDLRILWIANAVALTTDDGNIALMKEFASVKSVEADKIIQLEFPDYDDNTPVKDEWTWGLKMIGIPRLREEFALLGEGVRIGIVDTGCDPSHPDLAGKIVGFKDAVASNPNPYDDQGHGTHCCGTMVGGNAGGTFIGIAPKAKLLVAKGLNAQGSGQESWLIDCMQWMADPDGNPDTDDAPAVVNCSWGSKELDTSFLAPVQNWVALGIFPCFAAGNSGPWSKTVGIPGGYLPAFAVGATGSRDRIAFFSSRGPVVWDGTEYIKPDVSAPGSGIYSAKAGGGYVSQSGTSMACPHVAGVIALLFEADPDLTIDGVRRVLEETSRDLGSQGKDNKYGAGRINAYEAVAKVLSGAGDNR